MIQPNMINFMDWAASLIIDFPEDDIPVLLNENDWKEWGNFLIQEESFAQNNVPAPQTYTDKWDWARDLYYVVGQND